MAVPPIFGDEFSDLFFEQLMTMDAYQPSLVFQNPVSLDIDGFINHVRQEGFVSDGRDELPLATVSEMQPIGYPMSLFAPLDNRNGL